MTKEEILNHYTKGFNIKIDSNLELILLPYEGYTTGDTLYLRSFLYDSDKLINWGFENLYNQYGKLVKDTILNSAQFKGCEINIIIDSIPVVVVPSELSI
jgi:hypothetical protein